jgi:hypothetical protein
MRKTHLRTITGNGSVDTITTSYEGQYLGQIISAALLSGDTIEKGGITVKPNVKYKEVVKKLDTTGIVTDATCDFTVTADQVTLSERILEVEPFQVNLQLCKKDFLSDYLALEMGNSAYKNLPTSFADYIMAHVAAKVAENVEQSIWGGLGANDGEFTGITVAALADADVNDVPGVTATEFTADNIIDELGKVVDAIPAAVYGKEGLTFIPTYWRISKICARSRWFRCGCWKRRRCKRSRQPRLTYGMTTADLLLRASKYLKHLECQQTIL